ncbi:MAG: M13 family peptidase, partial [Bdellovibrio sp.]
PETLDFFQNNILTLPVEQLKNALLWHVVRHYMDDAYPEYFAKSFAFNHKHLGGPERRPDRQERCTKSVMSSFSRELDEELIPVLFPNFPEKDVVQLSEQVRDSIIKGLKKNSWLSPSAKLEAQQKIKSADLLLVKPKNERQWHFHRIDRYDRETPYANKKKLEKNTIEEDLRDLNSPRPRDRWEFPPLAVNANYSPPDNRFVLLQGVLQAPFYTDGQSRVANLGGMGSVVGHELGHAIDDEGAKRDHLGRLRQWMSEKDLAEFKKRGESLIERYQRRGHDGRLTLGENIADLVGVSFAYQTAFPDEKSVKVEDQKQFFTSWARLWCGVWRPEAEKLQLKTNAHALSPARVNEPLTQHPAFAKAFQCKNGDKMYLRPEEQVHIWTNEEPTMPAIKSKDQPRLGEQGE